MTRVAGISGSLQVVLSYLHLTKNYCIFQAKFEVVYIVLVPKIIT